MGCSGHAIGTGRSSPERNLLHPVTDQRVYQADALVVFCTTASQFSIASPLPGLAGTVCHNPTGRGVPSGNTTSSFPFLHSGLYNAIGGVN